MTLFSLAALAAASSSSLAPTVGQPNFLSLPHATTRVVDPNGTGPYRTIQSAIDAAQPGDVIEVADGTYREALVWRTSGLATAPITLRAQNPGRDISGKEAEAEEFARKKGRDQLEKP